MRYAARCTEGPRGRFCCFCCFCCAAHRFGTAIGWMAASAARSVRLLIAPPKSSLSPGVDSAGRRESYRPTHTPSTHPLDVPAEGPRRPQNPRGIKMGHFEGVERSMQCAQNTLEMPQSRKGRAFSGIPRGFGGASVCPTGRDAKSAPMLSLGWRKLKRVGAHLLLFLKTERF